MTVINPPGFLQNAGATHSAEQFRNWLSLMVAGKVSTTSLVTRGGVNPALGNTLSVTQAGSPNMTVVVKSGCAVIPGSEGSKQGAYFVLNDADVTLSIAAAHASLNRIDSVAFKVEDAAYSGVPNTSSLVVITGTPAGSPSPPTLPNNSIELARVSVVAGDTSITNGEITDRRFYLASAGGIITCTSTTRPAANTVGTVQLIFETDTVKIYVTTDSGSTWKEVWTSIDRTAWTAFTPAISAVSGSPAIGNGTITGAYKQIGKVVHARAKLILGTTTSMGTSQFYISLPVAAHANAAFGTGSCRIFDAGTANRAGICFIFSTLDKVAFVQNSSDVTNLVPQTFVSTDEIEYDIVYEAA